MDDRRIEEMLRESWTPTPPDGMRERILRRTREELLSRRSAPGRWKLALATIGLLVVLVTGVSDHARQTRLTAMMDGHASSLVIASDMEKASYFSWRREFEGSIAMAPADNGVLNLLKRGGLL